MIVAMMSLLLVTVISAVYFLFIHSSPVLFSFKAAIVDQLGAEIPNPTFVGNVTTTLQACGFEVAYYNETIDVDFFKELAKRNYGIIILRAHSALRDDNSTVDLFTSEPYSLTTHVYEQENHLVVMGTLYYGGGSQYFAITSKFVEDLDGTFPKSVIIAMGCWGLKPGLEETLAGAFVKKGAKAFLGWTDLVEISHSDSEVSKLLTNLLIHNTTLGGAVAFTMPDSDYSSQMKCYPTEANDLKISDLAAETNTLTTSEMHLTTLPYSLIQTLIIADYWSNFFRIELCKWSLLDVSFSSQRPCATDCARHRLSC